MQRLGVAERTGVRVDEPVTSPAFTALAWAAGLATTAMILGTPYLVFGYHSASLHLVLDSVDSCIAFLLAYLLYGRFARSRRLQDLLLAEGLFLLGLAGLGLSLLLSLLDPSRPRTLDVWLPLSLRVVAALLIVASALMGSRPAPARWTRWARTAPWVFAAAMFAALWLARDVLPSALDQSPPASAQRPVVEGHWALLSAQALTAACFLVASLGFMRQAMYRHDELISWLGPACALGGFARVNYVLFPSLYSNWVYTGDLLRTGSYVLLLFGAAREIGHYWSAQARAAVLEDRRRLARELHDGVVQELGYIRSESHAIEVDHRLRERILGACDRGWMRRGRRSTRSDAAPTSHSGSCCTGRHGTWRSATAAGSSSTSTTRSTPSPSSGTRWYGSRARRCRTPSGTVRPARSASGWSVTSAADASSCRTTGRGSTPPASPAGPATA